MTRRLSWLVFAAVLAAAAVPVRASSLPVIQGRIAGIELCPQSVCGSAIFVGLFTGQVGINPRAIGSFAVAVTHDELPVGGATSAITGGVWQIQLLSGRKFAGVVNPEGSFLKDNQDGTYSVVAQMDMLTGGSGWLTFAGTLSHNTFPPTIIGAITQ